MENELSDKQKACIPNANFKLIPIKDLVSNQEYQRPLSESHILKAIEEFEELQYQEEAHIFAEQQKNVKTLAPYEVFNAHLEAGDEKQLMIVELVRSYGLEVSGDKIEAVHMIP